MAYVQSFFLYIIKGPRVAVSEGLTRSPGVACAAIYAFCYGQPLPTGKRVHATAASGYPGKGLELSTGHGREHEFME